MNILRSKKLLQRYLSRTATAEEIEELMVWIAKEDNIEDLKATSNEAWASFQEADPVITRAESERMLSQVLGHERSAKLSPEKRRQFLRPRLLKIAAALLVVVASGVWLQRNPAPTAATVPTGSSSDIAPGGYNATLTLSSGAKIALNSVQNGVLVNQGGSQIIKMDSGELVYRRPSPGSQAIHGKTEKDLYNILSTPRSGQYRITLPDGTKAWLNASSSIRYPIAFQGKERRIEVQGEVYLEVKKDYARPFIVKIASATGKDMGNVKVLGTDFNINAYMDESTVKTTLVDGAIAVSKGNDLQLLKPGDQATIGRVGNTIAVSKVNAHDVIAWKNGFFRFRGDDIALIMNEIARWYDVQIVYKNNRIPNEHYSGVISRDTPLSEVLKILEAGGFHFAVRGREIVVEG